MELKDEAKCLLLGEVCGSCKYVYTPAVGTTFCFLVVQGGQEVDLYDRCDKWKDNNAKDDRYRIS